LRPGRYTLTESQPRGYVNGKESLGTAGGILGNDRFSDIVVASQTGGVNYDFGELEQKRTPVKPSANNPAPSKSHFLASAARRTRR
jgi:hypothetical protein